MYYTDKVKELLKRKNPNLKFTEEEVQKVNNGVIIRIIENSVDSQSNTLVQGRKNNSSDKLVAHISYQLCKDEGSEIIYLNFIRVENNFKNTKMSKYIMAYFIGHLIQKYGNISIELQDAANSYLKINVRSCKRMKTQVRALTTETNIVLPRNSTLRSGKVRLEENYWKKFGFQFKDGDPSEMEYTGKLNQYLPVFLLSYHHIVHLVLQYIPVRLGHHL